MYNIELHPGQSRVFYDLFVSKEVRYAVPVCSRGWGKSYFAATAAAQAVAELMELPADVPNKLVFIIAPTYTQVTDIYYPILAHSMGMSEIATKHSKDTGRFEFPGNVELRLISYEAIERMRGLGAYFVVCDEVASWSHGVGLQEAWQGIIQPCINTRWSKERALEYGAVSPGRAAIIGTPKGFNFHYDMFNYEQTDDEWKSYHFDYTTSPYLDATEIERLKHTIDPLKFNREYKATFEDSGNSVFYCFDRKTHVRVDLEDFVVGKERDDSEEIHVAIDFNVGIMCASICAIRGGQLHIIEEMKGHPDTETLGKALRKKYPHQIIKAYPDPSGRARKTSAPVGITDFTILEKHNIKCIAREKHPPIVDSVNAVNARLKSAAGDVNLYIHPRCTGVITSLERTKWVENNPDKATIDKSEGVEHYSDGIRYIVEFIWPIKRAHTVTRRGFNF
jgi:hypothetical protein